MNPISRKKSTLLLFMVLLLMGFLIIPEGGNKKEIIGPATAWQEPALFIASEINDFGINASILPKINTSVLNSAWKESTIDMIIITPDSSDFVNAITPLMEWKNQKGVKTIILRNFSKYEGKDNAEKIRNMIRYYHENYGTQWVLLAGDAEEGLIPIREVYNPDVVEVGHGESEYDGWSDYYKPTDFYYADLDGTWDDNGNGKYGESALYTGSQDEIEWMPDVYVGRFPASSASDLEKMVNKTLQYEKEPHVGKWMNKMLLAGGISSLSPLEDEAKLTTYIWQQYILSEMNFTHLYRIFSPYDPPAPPEPNEQQGLTHNSFLNYLNRGYSTILIAGHGLPTKFNDYFGDIYTSSDASTNYYMPSLIYSDACSTASYDKTDNNLGETLIKRVDSGAIGFIGALRITWYFENDENFEMLNRGNAKLFWEEFFLNEKYQPGKALFDSKVAYMNSSYFTEGSASMNDEWERKNVLSYCLLGDPEIDIYTDLPVGVKNSFKGTIYECEQLSVVIRNERNELVPNARVHVHTADGYSRTFYSDAQGKIEFQLPEGRKLYNVTITGHNLLASNFNFRTTIDKIAPECENPILQPANATISDNITFGINAEDLQTGIESVHAVISSDNFKSYTLHQLHCASNNSNNDYYYCNIDKLKPGEYSIVILARDYANNTEIYYNRSLIISIPTPIIQYVLHSSVYFVFGFFALSFYLIYYHLKAFKKYQEGSSSKTPA
ncbi:MAG: C25 family cysteine peptidase [Promethearchaeota archaeon]